ncbi:DUF998 domain-containing protein [Lysobacter sp. S4-A87]|uniref:DUF998 domain-containing protein n=1 Tax=Lysobacter sp. S4-A87 TaxID=2925843 RepID=UPI001F535EBA|nr:DUF998 domain-containing protein [Lysobacter sp. S4-A87]UNK51053.1 DUF998 domain-containing protein [Lysobacter sp. S4-A87]
MKATGPVDTAVRRKQGGFLDGVVRQRSGLICLMAVIAFLSTCIVLQWLRTDLDWRQDPLSAYLKGPYGGWLRMAYYALSMALMLLGAGLYRVLQPQARSAVPAFLLALAGIALALTAISETDLPLLDHDQENQLHRLAALTTFLSVTLAMMVQSWRFHYDEIWRVHVAWALPWAVATFIALWIYAYWHGMPEGLRQKTVISMILLWLGTAASWLRRVQLVRVREGA